MHNLVKIFLLLVFTMKCYGMEQSHAVVDMEQSILDKTLSIEKTMNDLKEGKIGLSYLPDAFFQYKSPEQFYCSPTLIATDFTPLMWLVMHADDPFFYALLIDSSISKKLLDPIDEKNSIGATALVLAVRNAKADNSAGVVLALLTAGADCDTQTYNLHTPLMVAAKFGKTDSSDAIMEMLLDAGADPDMQNIYGTTALMLVVENSYTATEILLDANANPNLKMNGGWTAIMIAVAAIKNGKSSEDIVQLLIDGGANPYIARPGGGNAFTFAVTDAQNAAGDTLRKLNAISDMLSELNVLDTREDPEVSPGYLELLSSPWNKITHAYSYYFGDGEEAAKIDDAIAQLSKLYDEQYNRLNSEEGFHALGRIIYVSKEISAGRMEARYYPFSEAFVQNSLSTKREIEATIETAKLYQKVGLQSWADKYFQMELGERIEKIEQLKNSKSSDEDMVSQLYTLKQSLRRDCERYLSDEALEYALNEGRYSIFSSSSTQFSRPNLRNNPWSKNRHATMLGIDYCVMACEREDHGNPCTPEPPTCFNALPMLDAPFVPRLL
jgi:ankyrin repeat protein